MKIYSTVIIVHIGLIYDMSFTCEYTDLCMLTTYANNTLYASFYATCFYCNRHMYIFRL